MYHHKVRIKKWEKMKRMKGAYIRETTGAITVKNRPSNSFTKHMEEALPTTRIITIKAPERKLHLWTNYRAINISWSWQLWMIDEVLEVTEEEQIDEELF